MVEKMYYKGYDVARKTMYDNIDTLIENNVFENKKIYIFGTSKIAVMILHFMKKKDIEVTGIIDNDKNKQGYVVGELKVEDPTVLAEYDEEKIILIASSYQEEMILQLENMGYKMDKNIIKIIDLPLLMNDYSFVDRTGYIEMKEKDIRLHQMNIMKYLKKVCEENNIDYYLAYGTLLGGVRHRGFIPWDDDVDIYIKGKDVDRLARLINQSDRYKMVTCNNCEDFFDQIPLLVDCNSVVDLNCFPLQATTGISIDIFPLYGVPSKEKELETYVEKLKNLEMEKWNCLYDKKKCHLATLKLNEYISSYDFDESEYTGFFLSPYFTKDYIRTECFAEKQYIMYEDEEYCIPGGYEEVLTTIYGDYMQLPPVEKRGKRHYYKAYYPHNIESQKDKNKIYWNQYYNQNKSINFPSNFAKDIACQLEKGKLLVDLGCGNGRDSVYFESIGMNVIAIDMSEVAIKRLKKDNKERNIQFYNGDFVKETGFYACEPDYFYSRFTIHAITEQQQNELIKNVYQNMKPGGKFFIEVRSVLDDIYGLGEEIDRNTYVYEGHSRRFIEQRELQEELEKQGFKVIFSEENRDFAPFKNQNPIVLRMIVEKK